MKVIERRRKKSDSTHMSVSLVMENLDDIYMVTRALIDIGGKEVFESKNKLERIFDRYK